MNAYEREPYRTELDVEIVGRGQEGNRHYVVLDDTILYPEGGGQPADHGWIGKVEVVDVQRVGGEVRHYLGGEADEDLPAELSGVGVAQALLRLDWERRFDHMQQHTAQHLITAVAADEIGWQTTSFHLGDVVSDIELDAVNVADDQLARLEQLVCDRIRAARSVTARRVSPEALESLDVRTRGLPEGHRDDVRLVEIEGVDRNTCGGTHLANTSEIESVALLGTEPMRGGIRLHWIAGARVRGRVHDREHQAAAVRRAFETSDEELLQVATAKLERLKEAEREIKSLRASLAQHAAVRLLASSDPILDGHFERADAGFLQLVARELLAAGGDRAALLTAEGPSGRFFVVCAPADAEVDVRATAARIAEILDGRGGGSPEMVQGVAGSLERRAEALNALDERAGAER